MVISQNQLKKLHQVELNALIKFDEVCRKHHITYTLSSGTLIGAIRCHGFIPWDDDVDVLLLRSELEKLRKIDPQEWGSDYFYQTNKTDFHYMYAYDKLRVNNTYFGEEALINTGIKNNGVFIDIFVADEVPFGMAGKLQILEFKILRFILMRKYVYLNHRHGWDKVKAQFVRKIFKNVSLKTLFDQNEKLIQKYDGIETNLYRSFDSFNVAHETYEKSYLTDVKDIDFEGHPLMVSKYYDEILSEFYGDYMKLPPVCERINKHQLIGLKI